MVVYSAERGITGAARPKSKRGAIRRITQFAADLARSCVRISSQLVFVMAEVRSEVLHPLLGGTPATHFRFHFVARKLMSLLKMH